MQQTKSYWRLIAVTGIVSAFIGSACVVTTSTDTDNGGATGNGGAGAGGAATAGATNSAGAATAGANTAGSSAAGAAQGGSGPGFQCDPPGEGGAVGDAASCAPDMPGNMCQECIQTSCCEEYGACYASDPGNQCGWGGPAKLPNGDAYDGGEALCIQLCIQDGVKMSGTEPDEELKRFCANNCNTAPDTGGALDCGSIIGLETDSLIRCMSDHCSQKCFGPLPTP